MEPMQLPMHVMSPFKCITLSLQCRKMNIRLALMISVLGIFTIESPIKPHRPLLPYRDLINRWDLVKKDPEAEILDPVEPIVWWMENTTPVQFREAIKEGAEAWNVAFEARGFSNAVVVKMQPDDAEWDAGDINHNVLRWTASPIPPFGGYGPSFANPRTGQLLGADIMLEWIYVNNRYKYQDLYIPEQASEQRNEAHDEHFCDFPVYLADNLEMGISTLEARGGHQMLKSMNY